MDTRTAAATLNGTAPVTPLNPGSFGVPADTASNHQLDLTSSTPSSGTHAGVGLDADDRIALQALLGVLRRARLAAGSDDAKLAEAGRWQILSTVSYLSGYLDSKGLTGLDKANAGFSGLILSKAGGGSNDAAGRVEEYLVQLLSWPETRGPGAAVIVEGLGAYLIKDGWDDIYKGITGDKK